MRAIRTYARDFAAILVLATIAVAVGGYILSQQRLRFPLLDPTPIVMQAEFQTAQAVTPGQGQTVRVSGVRIGDIAKTELRDGRALVTMDIEPEFEGFIRTDATALLRPKTGLKDMFIELDPGSSDAPEAPEGFTIGVQSTLPDVNPDEIFRALDADTRDYLRLLLQGAGDGLMDRGKDLREVFRRFEPTHRDLARVTGRVAERRRNLSRLINRLDVLNAELASGGEDLSEFVDSSADVLRSFASVDDSITGTLDELPSALRETTTELGKIRTFAEVLGPTAERLRPAARELDPANRAVAPFARSAAPVLRDAVRPFTRAARPLVRDLRPTARRLADATPDLDRSFVVLDNLFNLLGHNPGGREGPEVATREEGYLYWLAWLAHNGGSVFSSADAHGTLRPVNLIVSCQTLLQNVSEEGDSLGSNELAQVALRGLEGVFTDPRVCGALAGEITPDGGD
jgi:phospholipid/cholesterol/gamma-HCH transport system substrate-binding protein